VSMDTKNLSQITQINTDIIVSVHLTACQKNFANVHVNVSVKNEKHSCSGSFFAAK